MNKKSNSKLDKILILLILLFPTGKLFTQEVKSDIISSLNDCETCYSFKPEPGRYVVDAWVKETEFFTERFAEPVNKQPTFTRASVDILITNRDNSVNTTRIRPSGAIIEGWQRVVGTFTIPEDAIYFEIELRNNVAGTADFITEQLDQNFTNIPNTGILTGFEFEVLAGEGRSNWECLVEEEEDRFNILDPGNIQLDKVYKIRRNDGIAQYAKIVRKLETGSTFENTGGVSYVFEKVSDKSCDVIAMFIQDIALAKEVFFDDLRIYPYDANMKSFVYDDTQRLIAEMDENNFATFYEYDLEGGLIRVKKETERGIYTIQETRSYSPKKVWNPIKGIYEIVQPNNDDNEGDGDGGSIDDNSNISLDDLDNTIILPNTNN